MPNLESRPQLSVNLNKIALLRNSRKKNYPDVQEFAKLALESGADGITMHPRPDLRHITPQDIKKFRENFSETELNLEGNPFTGAGVNYPGFLEIVKEALPEQCTLVPDSETQLTSDHGWDLKANKKKLVEVIRRLTDLGIRTSLFVDGGCENLEIAKEIGVSRIELYTESFHDSYGTDRETAVFKGYLQTAYEAKNLGLGLNAGHDLNLKNLSKICLLPNLLEVSIGHALIVDALLMGFGESVRHYKTEISKANVNSDNH